MWLFQSVPAYLSLTMLTFSVILFLLSVVKVRNNAFFSDTPVLIPLGIYVWGDAVVLSLFWFLLSTFALFQVSLFWLSFFVITFLSVRSAIEVVYWLHQQFQTKPFNPPFFRKYFSPLQSAILLQLWHTLIVVFGVVALSFLFLIGLKT